MIIKFGFFNKKLLLPFGVALFQILINIMNLTLQEKVKNSLLEMIGTGLSQFIEFLIPLFNISALKTNNKNILNPHYKKFYNCKRRSFHYLILIIIFSAYIVLNIIISMQTNLYQQKTKSFESPHNSGFSSLESFEIIFICLVSILLLKYKYFIHHTISIIIFVLVCISIDSILDNFTYIYERGYLFIILNISKVLLDGIDYGYQKYMMDVLFHPFWGISTVIGATNLIIFSAIITLCLIKGKEEAFKENNNMFIAFYQYFEEVPVKIIIIKHLLNFILSFFLNLFRILTLLHLTPDYILISFTISRIIDIVIETKQYIILALFPIQFIILLFYLEILEFNFCGLNRNTKKNIQRREEKEKRREEDFYSVENNSDGDGKSSNYNEIEISSNYIVLCKTVKSLNDDDDENNDNERLSREIDENKTINS